MAQELYEYIYNVEHRPNKTGVLLAIPMYMYRIETYKIEYGINFFQKAVLMFKTKPGIDNSTIANCLGLDEELVNMVAEQLVTSKLIGSDGRLTHRGKEIKDDIDGLIVDESKKSIGYVFQHVNDEGLYSFYVNNIQKATVINGDICTGTKGENGEEDYYTKPILADKLLDKRVVNYAPNEREILGMIRRSNKHIHSNKEIEPLNIDASRYGISFVPNNHPSLVWVCTYAYVPRIKEDIYGSEWEIQDPFGFENSSELKLYIEALLSDGLIEDFTCNFKDLKTVNDHTIDTFQAMMDEMVDTEMGKSFDIGYYKLDKNTIKYLRAVLKNYLLLRRNSEIDTCGSFIGNIQNTLETIFKIDFEKNETTYRKVINSFRYEYRIDKRTKTDFFKEEDRYDYIDELFITGGLKADQDTQRQMKNIAKKFDIVHVTSLRQYLIKFLFGYKYNKDNPLYDIIKDKVGVIYKIGGLRNIGSHGQTSSEKQIRSLSVEEIELYYNELKQIINNYIIRYNGQKG